MLDNEFTDEGTLKLDKIPLQKPKKPSYKIYFVFILVCAILIGGTFLAKEYLLTEKIEEPEIIEEEPEEEEKPNNEHVFNLNLTENNPLTRQDIVLLNIYEHEIAVINLNAADFGKISIEKERSKNYEENKVLINDIVVPTVTTVNAVHLFADLVMVQYNEGDDSIGISLVGYNSLGEVVMQYRFLDDENFYIIAETINYKDNEITFNAARTYHGNLLNEGQLPSSEEFSVCKKETWSDYDIYEDSFAVVEFKIIYLQAENSVEIEKNQDLTSFQEIYDDLGCNEW